MVEWAYQHTFRLPALLGRARPWLSAVPAVLYCHETQLTYPLQPAEKRDLTYGMINWLAMLAAERALFNSRHHLEAWFAALAHLGEARQVARGLRPAVARFDWATMAPQYDALLAEVAAGGCCTVD